MCSDYGTARHFSFGGNGFFFCHPCDMWDSIPPVMRRKSLTRGAAERPARLACTAAHESFAHPTTLCRGYCSCEPAIKVSRNMNDDNSEDSESTSLSSNTSISMGGQLVVEEEGGGAAYYGGEDNTREELDTSSDDTAQVINNQPAPAVMTSPRTLLPAERDDRCREQEEEDDEDEYSTIRQLKDKIHMLRRWNLKLTRAMTKMQDEANTMKLRSTTSAENRGVYLDELMDSINCVTERHNRRYNASRTSALVAKAIWNHEVFHAHLVRLARKYIRETVFTPFNILREMDLAGGTLSYEGIDVLRHVETRGVKRSRGSVIPSKSEIKRIAGIVEWFARQRCPFQLKENLA